MRGTQIQSQWQYATDDTFDSAHTWLPSESITPNVLWRMLLGISSLYKKESACHGGVNYREGILPREAPG